MYNNGKKEPLLRVYDSLQNFVGENKVYKYGDILCISTKNNGDYDICITADGKSTFRELFDEGHDERDYSFVAVKNV